MVRRGRARKIILNDEPVKEEVSENSPEDFPSKEEKSFENSSENSEQQISEDSQTSVSNDLENISGESPEDKDTLTTGDIPENVSGKEGNTPGDSSEDSPGLVKTLEKNVVSKPVDDTEIQEKLRKTLAERQNSFKEVKEEKIQVEDTFSSGNLTQEDIETLKINQSRNKRPVFSTKNSRPVSKISNRVSRK